MPQHYFIDERNRTRPTFPEPPGPAPVQREPYALSAFEKDADWLRRNPEQNPDPSVRVAPADTVMGMVPDPSFGARSGAAKLGTGLHPKGVAQGYAAELQKGKVDKLYKMGVPAKYDHPGAIQVQGGAVKAKPVTSISGRRVQTEADRKWLKDWLESRKPSREVIFPGSKPGPMYRPSQREIEWKNTHHMSGAPAAPRPPYPY